MNKIKTRQELKKIKGGMAVYYWLLRNDPGLLDRVLPGTRRVHYNTLENCKKEALKYKTRNEWQLLSSGSYSAAQKKGWIDECCEHMPKNNTLRKIVNLDTGKIYDSAASVSRDLGVNRGSISSVCSGKIKTSGGYRWAYCDEDGNIIK